MGNFATCALAVSCSSGVSSIFLVLAKKISSLYFLAIPPTGREPAMFPALFAFKAPGRAHANEVCKNAPLRCLSRREVKRRAGQGGAIVRQLPSCNEEPFSMSDEGIPVDSHRIKNEVSKAAGSLFGMFFCLNRSCCLLRTFDYRCIISASASLFSRFSVHETGERHIGL